MQVHCGTVHYNVKEYRLSSEPKRVRDKDCASQAEKKQIIDCRSTNHKILRKYFDKISEAN